MTTLNRSKLGTLGLQRSHSPQPPNASSGQPRPSTSSNRSFTKTEADFEAALLNPGATKFLSGSPVLGDDTGGFGDPLETPPRPRQSTSGSRRIRDGGDRDAPVPVDKRSFEDDMRDGIDKEGSQSFKMNGGRKISNGGVQADGLVRRESGSEAPSTPKGIRSPSVIPPTPSSNGSAITNIIVNTPTKNGFGSERKVDKRISQSTVRTIDSGGSSMSPSRLSVGSAKKASVGIDAELNEGHKTKKQASKRRSIFRSPGTASSPDLATLVRKAKEAKGSNTFPPSSSNMAAPAQTQAPHKTLQKAQYPTRQAPLPPIPDQNGSRNIQPSQSASSRMSSVSSGAGGSSAQTPHRTMSRLSGAADSEDSWDKFGSGDLRSLPSGERMATISETKSSRSRESSGRSRESSREENTKTLRNKAKGMFGRMFGASKDLSPSTSPSSTTTARMTEDILEQPPVPPVPSAYRREPELQPTPEIPATPVVPVIISQPPPMDAFRITNPDPPSSVEGDSPKVHLDDGVDSSNDDGRRSVTPTARRPSGIAPALDKALPPIRGDSTPSVSPELKSYSASSSRRTSMHVRQPAYAMDDELSSQSTSRRASPSPRRPVTMSFSDDVAGIFDSIGQSDPARELGLPPDSMRIKNRTQSADSPVNLRTKPPLDIGRSPSTDRSRPNGHTSLLSPVPSQRTSSLPPNNSPNLGATHRNSSSPIPSPRPSAEDGLLPPPRQSLLSDPAQSSRRRNHSHNGPYQYQQPVSLGPPLMPSNGDFGPTANGKDDTIRPRQSVDLPPLSPASIRLVTSPKTDGSTIPGIFASQQINPMERTVSASSQDPSRPSSLLASSVWGRQSPSPSLSRSNPKSQNSSLVPQPSQEDVLQEVESLPVTPVIDQSATPADMDGETDEEKGRKLACEFLDDDFTSVPHDRVAEFLGRPRPVNTIALRYYMTYFNMKGQTLVEAFRDLCAKLYLKAESQEIDRIIEGFSARYYDCNPTTVFGSPGVVHTVTAAMLMLNTDLHIAELSKHMSRGDFVKNAIRAIQESAPEREGSSTPDLVRDDSGSVRYAGAATSNLQPSASVRAKTAPIGLNAPRSASAPVMTIPPALSREDSERSIGTINQVGGEAKARSSSTTVSSFNYTKAWESEAENALKDIFNQVRADKILLPIFGTATNNRQSVISLGSEYGRPRNPRSPGARSNDRVNVLKRGSIRGMQGLTNANNPYGSAFSNDGRLSPTPSYATSIQDTIDGHFAPTIGFASNLSHTVIKEQDDERSLHSGVSDETADEDLNDDELALIGPPWAKEGILWRRTGNEAALRKTAKKDWKQFFVVVQRGELSMHTFGSGSGSNTFGTVGGGNWTSNANTAGQYSLVQAVATGLPGGYAKDRPHVFSISFPGDETIYLQAGTDDLVGEWVATCNYWSARKSRQPLQGGVSNMEYGWQRVLPTNETDPHRRSHSNNDDDRMSVRSGKSNMSKMGTYSRRTIGSNPADKMHVNDWKPPAPSLMPSPLDEENQLEALVAYVQQVKEELKAHKELEEPMKQQYSPGSKNYMKATQNFTLRGSYLVKEIYRYEGYIDTLRSAIALRLKKQGEKKLEKSLARSMTSLHRRESEASSGAGYLDASDDED